MIMKIITLDIVSLVLKISLLIAVWMMSLVALWALARGAMAMVVV